MTSRATTRFACVVAAGAALYWLRRRLVDLLTITSGTWVGSVTPAPAPNRNDTSRGSP